VWVRPAATASAVNYIQVTTTTITILEYSKKLYFGFVDLEKAFDRVPREVITWAMRKLGVEEWLVSAVMSMYTGAKTFVRTVCGNSEGFEVKVMPTSTKPQAGKLG